MNPNTKQQVEWLHINLGLNFLEIPELYLDEGESDQEELLERGLIEEYNPGIDREIEKMPENAGLDDDKSANLQGLAGLKDDLEQIERVVIHSNKPTKPAILEGMFKSVQSVLSSVERQLVSFMATEKEQQEIRSIAGRVKDNLLLARETQVSKNLIMDKTGDFQTQLEIMERAENSIDKVAENCLPKLTSRVPNPGENLPLATNKQNATTQVPEIKKAMNSRR